MTDFIVVGNTNAVTYKEVFPLFKSGKVRLGYIANRTLLCRLPEDAEDYFKKDDEGNKLCKVNPVSWFVTLPVEKEPLVLTATYTPEKYPKYDNYDAINVDRVEDIPYDYDGVMGVPISFFVKHNPNQFEILDARDYTDNERLKKKSTYLIKDADGSINGKNTYARVLIRRKEQ